MSKERLTSGLCTAHSVIPASENVSLFVIKPSVFANCHPSKLGSVEQCLSVRGEKTAGKVQAAISCRKKTATPGFGPGCLCNVYKDGRSHQKGAIAKGLINIANVH